MHRYKKIVVAMSLEQGDASAVNFASTICRAAESEEVHYFHVTDEFNLDRNLCSALEDNASCEILVGRMKAEVERVADGFGQASLYYEASDGDRLKDILGYIKTTAADLVVIQKVHGGSKIPERLARKAPCSVLLTPPDATPQLNKIFVAIDFSEYSRDALDNAVAFAKTSDAKKLTLMHVDSIPLGYQKTGNTYEQFAEKLVSNSRVELEKMAAQQDLGDLEVEIVTEIHKRPYQGIADIVRDKGADLLVVGVRGQSKTTAVLMGSVTERLIELSDIPILTVKRKGHGLSFLNALLGL